MNNKKTSKDEKAIPSPRSTPTVQGIKAADADTDISKMKLRPSAPWTRDQCLQFSLLIVGIIYGCISAGLWYTTRQGIHSGQRAYLIPETFVLAEPLEANHPVKITFIVKNTGQTPAIHVQRAGRVGLLPTTVPPILVASDNSVVPGSVGFLGAGDSPPAPDELWLDNSSSRLLQPSEIRGIQAGALHLFASVVIDYDDVFGHRDQTKACRVYEPGRRILVLCSRQNDLR